MSLLKRMAGLFRGQALAASDMPPQTASEPPAPSATPSHAARTVDLIRSQALGLRGGGDLSKSVRWGLLKSDPPELQVAVLRVVLDHEARRTGHGWRLQALHRAMLTALLRRNLPLTAEDLTALLTAWAAQRHSLEYGLPGLTILGAVERFEERCELPMALRQVLKKILARATQPSIPGQPVNKTMRSIADRVRRLLDPSSEQIVLPAGAFAKQFTARLDRVGPDQRTLWLRLARIAAEAGAKSKPTQKWGHAMSAAIAPLGHGQVAREVLHALDSTTPDPTRPDDSLDILKGFVWACPQLDHTDVVGSVGRFADRCFRKAPGVGAHSVSLGNAALWALSEMSDEPHAAAELFRLRDRVKTPSTRRGIEARLGDLALNAGQTVEDLEELSLPDFGLSMEGGATLQVGEARAELRIHPERVELQWFNRDGKSVKSAPAEVRTGHAGALSDVRRRVREIDEARAAQSLRLERAWVEERSWGYAEWTERYLRHPLRRPLVEALVWRIGALDLMVSGSVLSDVEGRVHDAPAPETRVQLWHPLDADPGAVLAWRQRMLALGVTQPIKQAHREVYVLTDAERQTSVYSNRFAAHILRQHQFRALCQARGWTYDLMGGWDSWSVPTRRLSKQALTVEYHVDVVQDGRQSDSGVALYLTTDQVRFTDVRNQAVELDTISPIVFSEVLRDVDLFVAVTSVANDPAWTDGGPNGPNGGYWREWAFGELGESARTRRELISRIAPKLSIADRLEVTDQFLVVTGRRQSYAIHFGSGNIQIRPSNRYLCIVPGRDPGEAAAIKLPFTGDGVLSTILAKAFLLADETKIKDPTILSQL